MATNGAELKHKRKFPDAPGPRGLFSNMRNMRKDRLKFFLEGQREFGDIVRYQFGPRLVFFLSHPDHVRHVLQDNHTNYGRRTWGYKKLRIPLGNGLVTSDGEFWRRQRRIAQPAFHRDRLSHFGTVMTNAAEEMIDRWQRPDVNEPLDVSHEMMKLTLVIVGRALFSTDIGETDEIGDAVTEIQKFVIDQMSRIVTWPAFIPTPSNLRLSRALRTVDRLVYAKIAQRRADGKDEGDLLSMLLAATDSETGAQMSDLQLRDEIVTMISAGHETTANTLSWTWCLLSEHPAIKQKLLAELDGVLRGRTPTIEDLPRLEYTTLVIKESMRLIPPVWAIGRSATEADVIGGYRIPAKSVVMVSPYLTHRHPEFWDSPEEFRPERFQSESALKLPRFAYFPFGGGPHLCIGNSFATMEAQLLLATIAQKFELQLQAGQSVELEPLITIRPKGGLWMKLSPRQAQKPAASFEPPVAAFGRSVSLSNKYVHTDDKS